MKSISDDVLDAALNTIKNNAVTLCLCSAEPTTRTEAFTTYELAKKTISSADYTGPSDGDSGGRKLVVNAEASVPVDDSGTATHVALVDATRLLCVTICTSKAVVSGDLVNFPAWTLTFSDPV